MPYNVWCEGCGNHVGMGVRYNAEKTKVGMYYTTPIYEFKMKCHLCDNYYVMRTDPEVRFLFKPAICYIYSRILTMFVYLVYDDKRNDGIHRKVRDTDC